MANIIIQNRLNKLIEKKRQLLTLKKKERGNDLKVTNETISRLKRWQRELDEKDRQKTDQKKEIPTQKKKKRSKKVKEGIQRMKQSMSRACDLIDSQIENDFVNVSKLEDYEIEFIEALANHGKNK